MEERLGKEEVATVLIAKRAVDLRDETPNTWYLCMKSDGTRSAIWTCPNGHAGGLLDHQIASDGVVSPSVVCNGYPAVHGELARPCTVHDYLKLEGWSEK